MSGFFTTPASQRKRKRSDGDALGAGRKKLQSRPSKKQKDDRDDSISGSDSDVGGPEDDTSRTLSPSSSEDEDETAAERRTKLASRYLQNTRKELLAEGFDAKDVDEEILAARMGERLKQDTAESKGKIYRWIADEFIFDECQTRMFSDGAGKVNGVTVCHPYIYMVSKDIRISKWRISESSPRPGPRLPKPKRVGIARGDRSRKRDPSYVQHTNEILCVAASQDGKFVATGGKDKKLIIWDADTLKPLRAFSHHRDAILSLCFRRGTNQLFSASRDRTVKIWSANELAYIETLYGHQDEVVDVACLTQEHCVTVGARDRTARFWKVVEENQLIFRGGGAHNSLAKRGADDRTGEKEEGVKRFHEGSTERVVMMDEETFVTGSDNGALALWNIQKKKPIFTYPQAHGVDGYKRLEDVSAEVNPDPKVLPEPQPRWITALVGVPFSNLFFSGSWDGHVRAWKVSQDKKRIEELGPLSTSSGPVMINGELGHEERLFSGVINDLAVFETGMRGKESIGLVAVTAKAQRLGHWEDIEGKNAAVWVRIRRKA